MLSARHDWPSTTPSDPLDFEVEGSANRSNEHEGHEYYDDESFELALIELDDGRVINGAGVAATNPTEIPNHEIPFDRG